MEHTTNTLGNTQAKNRTIENISLSCRQVYRLQNYGKSMHIQGVKGTLYITQPNDPDDYILKPGQKMIIRSRGLVLVQGLPEGVFCYSPG